MDPQVFPKFIFIFKKKSFLGTFRAKRFSKKGPVLFAYRIYYLPNFTHALREINYETQDTITHKFNTASGKSPVVNN